MLRIEGIPVIIRFKTVPQDTLKDNRYGIEGIPVIIRFKTSNDAFFSISNTVLKAFQLE